MQKRLSFQALQFGFRATLANIKVLIFSFLAVVGLFLAEITVVTAVLFVAAYVLKINIRALPTIMMGPGLAVIFTPVVILLTGFMMGLYLGFKKLALDIYDQKPIAVRTIFSCFRLVPTYACASFLYGLITFSGMLLLIIPGIYWGIRFCLFPFFIVDQHAGITDSLRMSYRATKGAFWDLFLFMFILGAVPMPIQLIARFYRPAVLFVAPFSFFWGVISILAFSYLYRNLVAGSKEA